MLSVSALYIYPIKSLGGIRISSAEVTDRGFKHDRQWMLIDEDNRFLSQREFPEMALFETAIDAEHVIVHERNNPQSKLFIPLNHTDGESQTVQIWDDACEAKLIGSDYDRWFSKALGISCRLVVMPPATQRKVDEKYAHNGELTSFSDAYPFLLIGEESLKALNARLTEALPMNRFRPNIVFSGGEAFLEDDMRRFRIAQLEFLGAKG